MRHHVDCDGYRFAHVAEVRQVSRVGAGMWRASCDRCPWAGSLVGPAARDLAHREANDHTEEVTCDGRCADWT